MVNFPIEKPAQRAVLGVAIAFSILPVVAVGLRLLARKIAGRILDISDYLIMVAAVSLDSGALREHIISGITLTVFGLDHGSRT
jgi:hypothetical protein